MKRNTKRLPALLLAIILCLGLLPTTAWALEISGEGWEFDLTDMSKPTLVIKSDDGMTDWIANGGSYRGIVLAVKLSEGITKIPYHAFWKCSQLTTVEIPASVTEMGKNDVFEGCTSLTEITVAEGNQNFFVEDGVLYGYEKDNDGNKINDEFIALICPPGKSGSVTLKDGTVEIGGSAFEDCTKLTGVTLNEGLTRIGSNAFGGCSSLQEVELPASLTSLGNGVFNGCTSLASLKVAAGNTKFSAQDDVLYNIDKTELLLYPAAKPDETFAIPNTVTRIDTYGLSENPHIKTVTANALTSIESSAFMNCRSLTRFSANSLDTVELQAFYGCSNLETFTLTEATSLKTIEQSAFSGCGRLTAAPIAGATRIEEGAFQDCTALTSLSFCETGNVSIGKNAFSGCTGLTELTFPASVTSIGYSAFGGCNQVTVITFKGETPPTCDSNSFSIGDPNEFQIIVPTSSEDAYRNALGSTLGSYVGDTLVKKYPLFVNGQQLTSENTIISCGSGTAAFDVTTSTLTLTNATIENMGGDYGYGGAINSGLAELTIKLVGNNTIHAELEQWGTTYRDSINSGTNCDVKIVSGATDGTTPTLICDLIDMGRGGSGFTGGAGEGNLTVDGVNLTVNDRIFVHHNTTFQNGAQVTVTGGLTVNNSATVKVDGENTALTVKYIALGNDLSGQTNRLVLDSGTLTITGSVAYPGAPDGDMNPYAIRFDPVSSGSIAINGGMFVKQASCAGTNIDKAQITQADNLPVQGNWEGGTLIIGPEEDGKHTVTVKSDPAEGGVAYGGGRYAKDDEVTLTVEANKGWFFIGWYQNNGETADSVSTNDEYTFKMSEDNVTFTARFIEDKLYQAEQAKDAFDEAQTKGSLTWAILTDALNAYDAVPDFLNEVKGIDDLLTEDEKTALDTRYNNLTTYYNGIEKLDLSNQDLSSADLEKLDFFISLTDLNLSGTGLTDLSALSSLAATLKTLNLSGNTGVSDLSALKSMTALETLDISNTGVTAPDSLITEDSQDFPGSGTLTAKNLTLASISALAELVSAEGFNTDAVTKWDFTGSTLPDTEDNRADVETIKTTLGEKFSPPTIQTTPDEPEIPDTPVNPGGGGVTTYTVTVEDAENGKVTRSPARAGRGTTVTITTAPDDGYELDKLTVTDARGSELELTDKGNGKYTFRMPASKVTVEAVFTEILPEPLPFIDVRAGAWYYDAVDYVYQKGFMTGTSENAFSPDMTMTRGMIVTILHRMDGAPNVGGRYSFEDVPYDAWYSKAVLWAERRGIVSGYSAEAFGPNDPITREQLAAILCNYSAYKGEDTSARADLSKYSDVSAVSGWAKNALSWANAKGLVNGVTTTTLEPKGAATRAQAATMLQRFCEQYSQNEG